MKTDDFIRSLAADSAPPWRFRSLATIGVAASVAVAAALFFALVGVRADIAQAMESVRFLFKFVVTIALAATAVRAMIGLGRPGEPVGPRMTALAIVPLLALAGAGAELLTLPRSLWAPSLVGHNARFCLTLIPLLAAGPLICLLAVLRKGAPSNPGLAGAAAGLAASGVGATFYAANCNDDSPLFVVTWYTIAILMVTAAGYLIGRKVLRW
ncbi:NrsF family protein [Methylocella sp.]|uniref:NrsF family protein n=1 Tax=Methylocella sp. TaxID=1978226 RepID=UPI0037842389